MQKIIKIDQCLLKLSRKQESVTDRQTVAITISPHRYRGGIKIQILWKYTDPQTTVTNNMVKFKQYRQNSRLYKKWRTKFITGVLD